MKKDENGKYIVDNSKSLNKIVILDTNKAKEVEVEYYKDSKACDDI